MTRATGNYIPITQKRMLSFLMSTFDSYIVTITTVETTRVLSAPFSAKIIPLRRTGTVTSIYFSLHQYLLYSPTENLQHCQDRLKYVHIS